MGVLKRVIFVGVVLLSQSAYSRQEVFAVIGDYGADSPGEQLVTDLVEGFALDYIVTTGDNSYYDTPIDQNVGKYYSDYIGNYSGQFGSGSEVNKFFPSLGNHDWNDGGGLTAYLSYFDLPGEGIESSNTSNNERYYDFKQGLVHFFVLDSDGQEPDGRDSSSIQAQWLKLQLSESDARWKIVYFHHPPYSSGYHGSFNVMRWPFEDWGADAILNGHDHHYERVMRDDNDDAIFLPYIISGDGGLNVRERMEIEEGSAFIYDEDFGAVIVTVRINSLTFDAYTVANGGELLESFVLTHETPTHIKNDKYQADISLIPNPVRAGKLTISIEGLQPQPGTVEILDMSGRLYFSKDLQINKRTSLEISTEGLNSGTYLVRVSTKLGSWTVKKLSIE